MTLNSEHDEINIDDPKGLKNQSYAARLQTLRIDYLHIAPQYIQSCRDVKLYALKKYNPFSKKY